jgi:hypothetical protein
MGLIRDPPTGFLSVHAVSSAAGQNITKQNAGGRGTSWWISYLHRRSCFPFGAADLMGRFERADRTGNLETVLTTGGCCCGTVAWVLVECCPPSCGCLRSCGVSCACWPLHSNFELWPCAQSSRSGASQGPSPGAGCPGSVTVALSCWSPSLYVAAAMAALPLARTRKGSSVTFHRHLHLFPEIFNIPVSKQKVFSVYRLISVPSNSLY